jgi:hypothetical protein
MPATPVPTSATPRWLPPPATRLAQALPTAGLPGALSAALQRASSTFAPCRQPHWDAPSRQPHHLRIHACPPPPAPSSATAPPTPATPISRPQQTPVRLRAPALPRAGSCGSLAQLQSRAWWSLPLSCWPATAPYGWACSETACTTGTAWTAATGCLSGPPRAAATGCGRTGAAITT